MALVIDAKSAGRTDHRTGSGAEPLRRKRVQPVPATASPVRRRTIHVLLVFVTVVLVVDALVGDKGLMQTMLARRQHRELGASLQELRQRNTSLRENVRRLLEDPAAIEALAREELGLVRPGELLFIIRDADGLPSSNR